MRPDQGIVVFDRGCRQFDGRHALEVVERDRLSGLRLLQAELKRVGCKAGDVGSDWDASARRALGLFNDNAGTRFDTKIASLDALDAVRARPDRVCPLECGRGFRASGDACTRIVCDDGYVLGPRNSCEKRREKAAANPRRSPASGGRRCFVYGGTSFCE